MNRQAALEVLTFNNKTVESLVYDIPKTNHIIMKDKDDTNWSFIIRRRCHLYILAKTPEMGQYEEIYKTR